MNNINANTNLSNLGYIFEVAKHGEDALDEFFGTLSIDDLKYVITLMESYRESYSNMMDTLVEDGP